MTPATEPEKRAVELVYERDFGEMLSYDLIATEQQAQILAEIRERAAKIEQSMLETMLMPKMKRAATSHRAVTTSLILIIGILALAGAAIFAILQLMHVI